MCQVRLCSTHPFITVKYNTLEALVASPGNGAAPWPSAAMVISPVVAARLDALVPTSSPNTLLTSLLHPAVSAPSDHLAMLSIPTPTRTPRNGNGHGAYVAVSAVRLLTADAPQPGILHATAAEHGSCSLSILATVERTGVLLVCGCCDRRPRHPPPPH